jgi:L-arabinokinase
MDAPPETVLAVYVSGHGFGHSTRTAEVLAQLRREEPALPIAVVTSAPAFLYEELDVPVRPLACDVGLVQRGPLVIDEDGTAAACVAFQQRWPALVEQEARWLRASGARLVLGDIPPLAFAAAQEAGLPSVALGNFSWDWIHRELARGREAILAAADAAARAYGAAGLLLELPFAGDLRAFPRRERIPMVARRASVSRTRARGALGLRDDRPAVLFSFGGFGLGTARPEEAMRRLRRRFQVLDEPDVERERLRSLGLGYRDVVEAVDVVVTKPGYGIVTDAIAAGARLVYTDRGAFPEYPVMVDEMARYLPVAYVTGDDLRAGRVEAALDDVLSRPWPARPRTDGAIVAAERLRERLV